MLAELLVLFRAEKEEKRRIEAERQPAAIALRQFISAKTPKKRK